MGASLFAAASNTGCGGTTPGGPISAPCPPGQTCQARLTLLHTADIHSRLYPYDLLVTQIDSDLGLGTLGQIHNVGGVARVAYLLGRERARADRVLHLDSGDCFQGAPVFNFFSGEPEVRAQSMMGIDAAVIGNHEFDRGALNVTNQFSKWANFPLLVANYKFDDPLNPDSPKLSTITRPFTVFNQEGLKVAVIGMGNLSSLTSIFDQPNRLGVTPLNTAEVAQFYVDLLRPSVDVIVMLTHLGLQVDEDMVRGTTGIDVVLGGHNHIVINPPQELTDCSADAFHPGFVWVVDPDIPYDTSKPAPSEPPCYDNPVTGEKGNPTDPTCRDPVNHPYMRKRLCKPRKVLITHSGAFAKYLGRLDLVLSNTPKEASPTANPNDYDPINGFEVVSSKYTAFPVDDQIPEDPTMVELLEPYHRILDRVADLDLLVGYSPGGAKRTAPQGGDSPLGNLVATAAWLRLGVQTDFSLTNTTGIRTDLNPGPVNIEQMYNIFPFDNSISKMQLSGVEVQDMFDFVARRSSERGCVSQAQIAGARVRLNCGGCSRPGPACTSDADCPTGSTGCDLAKQQCIITACAEDVYIGNTDRPCTLDKDCADTDGTVHIGQCDVKGTQRCLSRITPTNLYELATSNYLAGGGSGFRVLQRNTTQFDTKIQQRDALIDYIRQGHGCGYKLAPDPVTKKPVPVFNTPEGLKPCGSDKDCASEGDFVCACPSQVDATVKDGVPVCDSSKHSCDPGIGRCILRPCRDDVAAFHNKSCNSSPSRDGCVNDLNACSIAGEECKVLSCVDQNLGAATDNRIDLVGR